MTKLYRMLEGPGFFRLVLALLVFVHHTSWLGLGPGAVYIFFILSGFWIATLWTGRYVRAQSPYLTYLLSRSWRLLPVFILCALISWALVYASGEFIPELDGFHQVISNLFILGYSNLPFKANEAAWSLDLEAQFYLVAPLVIAAIARSRWAFLGIAALSYLAFCYDDHTTVLRDLVFFAIGIEAATFKWKPEPRLAWASLLLAVVVPIVIVASPLQGVIVGGANRTHLLVYNGFANIIFAALLAPWAIYTTGNKSGKTDVMFADLSYIVYLLHLPVLTYLAVKTGGRVFEGPLIVKSFTLVMISSWLIWRFYDRPINDMRSNWVAGRIVARPAPFDPAVAGQRARAA